MFFGPRNLTAQDITRALASVEHPIRGESLVSLGMVSGIIIKPGAGGSTVTFVLDMEEGDHELMQRLREASENAVRTLKGVSEARAIFTAKGDVPPPPAAAAATPQGKRSALPVGHLGKIIAVISGKGGVGKSTVSANLAVSLAARGLRVGLLDADVYGPSVPRLFALNEKPETKDGKLVPLEKYGLKIMSIGFMVAEETPVIWRGAMVQSALRQMLMDVAWGELDTLVIDMPPGTGDAQLTLAQSVPMAGAVIVSTPQDLALIDARKAISMFRRVEVPILGLIENMSSFVCPHCGEKSDIFGAGGAEDEARRIGADFLGAIPLTMRLRETSDAGTPLSAIAPQDAIAEHFRHCADRVWEKLQILAHSHHAPPKIIIEE
jgi:ATP-binding protein involved in chromosome partitioning